MVNMTAVEFFFNELQRMQYFIGNDAIEAYKEALNKEKAQRVYEFGRGQRHEQNISSQTEISDEEIEEMLFHHSNEYALGFKDAINWYREQLKQRQ